MTPLKLFDKKKAPVDWDYDGDADTLYISFGKPRPAVGVDVGEGVVVRYDEKAKEVVGLTIIGVGRRLEQHIIEVAWSFPIVSRMKMSTTLYRSTYDELASGRPKEYIPRVMASNRRCTEESTTHDEQDS